MQTYVASWASMRSVLVARDLRDPAVARTRADEEAAEVEAMGEAQADASERDERSERDSIVTRRGKAAG